MSVYQRRRRRTRVRSYVKKRILYTVIIVLLLLIGYGGLTVVEKDVKTDDVNIAFSALKPARTIIDAWGVDLYLKNRLESIITEPFLDVQKFITFQYAQTILRNSNELRLASDLKYSFYVLGKQKVKDSSDTIYYLLKLKNIIDRYVLGWTKVFAGKKPPLISENEMLWNQANEMRKKENELQQEEIATFYEEMLKKKKYQNIKPYILYRLAFFIYQSDPEKALSFLNEIYQYKSQAPAYLVEITKKLESLVRRGWALRGVRNNRIKPIEQIRDPLRRAAAYKNLLDQYMELGLINNAAEVVDETASQPTEYYPKSFKEYFDFLEGYLYFLNRNNEKTLELLEKLKPDAESQNIQFLSRYVIGAVDLSMNKYKKFSEAAAQLADNYDEQNYSANLRFQAWASIYYGTDDREKAQSLLNDLQMKNSLDAISYPEKGAPIFRRKIKIEKGPSNIFKTFFLRDVNNLKYRVNDLYRAIKEDEISKRYSEEEFDQFIILDAKEHLPSYVQNVGIQISEAGFELKAQIKIDPITIDVHSKSIVELDRENLGRIKLKVKELYFGPFPIARFILKDIEGIFDELFSEKNYPLNVTDIQYDDGVFLVEAKKIHRKAETLEEKIEQEISERQYGY